MQRRKSASNETCELGRQVNTLIGKSTIHEFHYCCFRPKPTIDHAFHQLRCDLIQPGSLQTRARSARAQHIHPARIIPQNVASAVLHALLDQKHLSSQILTDGRHMIMSRPTPPETITSINATMTVLPAFELAGWTTATFLRGRGEAVKPGSLPFPVRFNRDALVADHHGMVRPCAGFHHNA